MKLHNIVNGISKTINNKQLMELMISIALGDENFNEYVVSNKNTCSRFNFDGRLMNPIDSFEISDDYALKLLDIKMG
jgi:hypothetical protein